MSDFNRQAAITLFFLSLAVATSALADTTIVFDDDREPKPSRIQIKDGMVRMQHADDIASYVIYNAEANEFTVVMPQQQQYMVMNAEQLAKVKQLQLQAIARMEEQLKQLPEGQRAQMREMMSQMMPQLSQNKALPIRRYEDTGQTDRVHGFNCRVVHVFRDETLSGEQCVAPHQALGISDGDFESLTAMFIFMADIAAQFSGNVHEMSDLHMALDQGVPVRYKNLQGELKRSGSMREVNNDELDPSLFIVPDNYQAQSLPDALGNQ